MALGMSWVPNLLGSLCTSVCLFQLTKALVMRSHPRGKTATLKVKRFYDSSILIPVIVHFV